MKWAAIFAVLAVMAGSGFYLTRGSQPKAADEIPTQDTACSSCDARHAAITRMGERDETATGSEQGE